MEALAQLDPQTASTRRTEKRESPGDIYFSADVETDGPIPGPYSMLSFALVFAGSFDGSTFRRPADFARGEASSHSDLDLFIVGKRGRMRV